LRLARLGSADVEQHEHCHEQSDELEPAGQHATEPMIRARPESVHLNVRTYLLRGASLARAVMLADLSQAVGPVKRRGLTLYTEPPRD
jgi:hypothetical protein